MVAWSGMGSAVGRDFRCVSVTPLLYGASSVGRSMSVCLLVCLASISISYLSMHPWLIIRFYLFMTRIWLPLLRIPNSGASHANFCR